MPESLLSLKLSAAPSWDYISSHLWNREDLAIIGAELALGQVTPTLTPPRRPGILTAVGGHLPLLIDQEQDEGKAEDAHDAGTCSQGGSRNV